MAVRDLAITSPKLVQTCGANRAVDGISLEVRRGAVFGLLGPNGAGKTTLVRIFSTLLKADGGSAYVLGYDVAAQPLEVRKRISLTGQFASVDEDLTGWENLVFLARLIGLPRRQAKARADELLQAFALEGAAGRQVKAYSGGMRRKLDIAASILRTPELLFLDEPTTGLDPRSRNQVWEIVRSLVREGATVLLTTQYLEEADALADRIAVIDRGAVIAQGTSDELKASVGTCALHVRVDDPAQRELACSVLAEQLNDAVHHDVDPRSLTAQLAHPDRAPEALAALVRAGIRTSSFSLGPPSLDEVFFSLTGHAPVEKTEEGERSVEAEGSLT